MTKYPGCWLCSLSMWELDDSDTEARSAGPKKSRESSPSKASEEALMLGGDDNDVESEVSLCGKSESQSPEFQDKESQLTTLDRLEGFSDSSAMKCSPEKIGECTKPSTCRTKGYPADLSSKEQASPESTSKRPRKLRRILSDSEGRALFEITSNGVNHVKDFQWVPVAGCNWWQGPLHTGCSSRRQVLGRQKRPVVLHSLCTGLGAEMLAAEVS